MTYAELIAEIKMLSKRGDIDDKIAVALRMITLRVHRSDLYWKDLVEANLTFASAYTVTVNVTTALTRFRQISYLQYLDAATGNVGTMLEEVDPSNILDDYNWQKSDVWYLAGQNLQVNFQYPSSAARIGYWQNPDVTPSGYNSWIATDLPDILVQGALAYLYNMLGKQEEARSLNRLVGLEVDPTNRAQGQTLLDQLKGSNIRGSGRSN